MQKLGRDSERPEILRGRFRAAEERGGSVGRVKVDGCGSVYSEAIGAKEGTGSDKIVSEGVVRAYIAGDVVRFVWEAKRAGVGTRGGEGVAVGEGKREGGKWRGLEEGAEVTDAAASEEDVGYACVG